MVRRASTLFALSVLLVWAIVGCSAPRSTQDMEATIVAKVVATLSTTRAALVATQVPPEPTATLVPEPTATPMPEPTTIPEPSVTPPAEIEIEEYVIYSAMLQQNPVGFDARSPSIIRGHTISGLDSLDRTVEQGRLLPARLVASYRSRNMAAYALEPSLEVEMDYAMMPEEDFEAVFGRGGEGWAGFQALYPKADGVISFSRVGLSENEDEALVVMNYRCGDLCGVGGLYLLAKEEGRWLIQETLMAWMS